MLEAAKAALDKAGFTISNLRNRIKELEAENEKLKEQKICEWKVDDPEYNTYKTGCGQYFNIIDGSLKDNGFKYCSYCGGLTKATE